MNAPHDRYPDAASPPEAPVVDRLLAVHADPPPSSARAFSVLKCNRPKAEFSGFFWMSGGPMGMGTRCADEVTRRAEARARIVVMQGKDAIGRLGSPRVEHLAPSAADFIRHCICADGKPGHWFPWVPITEADADRWFVVDLASTVPTDAEIVAAYEAAQRDGVKPGDGVIWLGRVAEAVMVGIYAIAMEVVNAAWLRESKRRYAELERTRRYQVTCEGDHPLDLDVG